MTLLAIWLVATGLISLLNVSFPGANSILAILAIAAGVVIGLGLRGKKLTSNLGMVLLALWLILDGVIPLLRLSFRGLDTLMALLAIATGGLLLFRR